MFVYDPVLLPLVLPTPFYNSLLSTFLFVSDLLQRLFAGFFRYLSLTPFYIFMFLIPFFFIFHFWLSIFCVYLIDYLGRVLACSHPQVARLVHQALLCHHLPSQVLVDSLILVQVLVDSLIAVQVLVDSLIAVQLLVDILVQIKVLLQVRVNFQVQAQDFKFKWKLDF